MKFLIMMNDQATISYSFINRLVVGILTFIACAIFIPIIFLAELDWWTIIIPVFTCVVMIYATIETFVFDFSVSFDYHGFFFMEYNRITKKKKIKSYKWRDVRNLTITGLYSPHSRPTLIVYLKNGPFDEIYINGLAYTNEFIKLARYYSGREGIIKPSYFERKRKGLYQKDW